LKHSLCACVPRCSFGRVRLNSSRLNAGIAKPPTYAESTKIIRVAEAAVMAMAPRVVPPSRTPSTTPDGLDRAEIRGVQSTKGMPNDRRSGCACRRRSHDEGGGHGSAESQLAHSERLQHNRQHNSCMLPWRPVGCDMVTLPLRPRAASIGATAPATLAPARAINRVVGSPALTSAMSDMGAEADIAEGPSWVISRPGDGLAPLPLFPLKRT
jgi:hypothetical protein